MTQQQLADCSEGGGCSCQREPGGGGDGCGGASVVAGRGCAHHSTVSRVGPE